jgi:hypothetical protein
MMLDHIYLPTGIIATRISWDGFCDLLSALVPLSYETDWVQPPHRLDSCHAFDSRSLLKLPYIHAR